MRGAPQTPARGAPGRTDRHMDRQERLSEAVPRGRAVLLYTGDLSCKSRGVSCTCFPAPGTMSMNDT